MALGTLTVQNVPVVVRSLLQSRGADVSNLRNNRIIALINNALEVMAYRVARGADYRGLQRDAIVLVESGIYELETGMIFDLARSVIHTAFGVALTPVDSLFTLTHGVLPLDQVYYTLEGPKLRFRDTVGALGTYEAAVTITANFIPELLAEVPPEYHEHFFSTLADLLTTQPAPRAQELAEVGRA